MQKGGLLVVGSFVVQGFFLSGGRKCVYLEMFMIVSKDLGLVLQSVSLVKPEELILNVLKDKGRMLC